MAKVAIKNENITSFGGIYHIMDVFSKFCFEEESIKTYFPIIAIITFKHVII